MAIRVVESVELSVTAEVAWRAFQRLEDWPRWFPTMVAVQHTGELAVGCRLVLVLSMAGRTANIGVKVKELQASRVRWIGRSLGVTGDHTFRVEPHGTGCRFTSDEIFSGLPLLLVPRRYLDALHTEARAGMQRFREMVDTIH